MTNFDFLDFDEQKARPKQIGLTRQSPMEEDSGGFFSTLGDIAAGVPRGIEGAVQDVYGLADTLTGDALPDYKTRLLGESKTTAGGIVEGVSNFLTGFLPVVGWLGKAGKIGRTLDLTFEAERALEAAGSAGKAALTGFARNAAAGAIADFTVFDGHEARLSNLIEQFPALENPVTEFLAANPDDPAIVGRFKASLEGLGLGAVAEGLSLGLKALWHGSKARFAGKTPGEIEHAMDAAVPPQTIDEVLHPKAGAVADEAAAQTGDVPPTKVFDAQELPTSQATGELEANLKSLGASPERVKEFQDALKNREAIDEEFNGGAGLPGQNTSATNPRKLEPDERAALELRKGDMNLTRNVGPDGAFHVLRTMEDILDSTGELQPIKTFGEQETASLNELADMAQANNGQSLMANLQRNVKRDQYFLARINRRVLAYKTAIFTYADEMYRKLPRGEMTDAARVSFAQELDTLRDLTNGVKGLLGEQGRGLGANRIQTRTLSSLLEVATDPEVADSLVKGLGGKDYVDGIVKKFQRAYEDGGITSATKLAKGTSGERFIGWTTSYFINAILSGPKTIVVNSMSGAFLSIYRPLENMLGAVVNTGLDRLTGKAVASDRSILEDTINELLGLGQGVADSFRAAKSVFKDGENKLISDARIVDTQSRRRGVISAANAPIDLTGKPGLAAATDFIGSKIDAVSRLMSAQDEFTKQMVYRSNVRTALRREAINKGVPTEGLGKYVADRMDDLIFQDQAYSQGQLYNRGLELAKKYGFSGQELHDEAAKYAARVFDPSLDAISQKGMAYANEATLTTPLPEKSLGAVVQKAAIQVPLLRFFVPFVRTPTNVLYFTGQRFDAIGAAKVLAAQRFPEYARGLENSKSRLVRDLLQGDERAKNDAAGRIAAGFGFVTFAATAAASGKITGRGPSDPEQRRVLQAAGWQPYSFKVGDSYVSYARLDPFATMLGTVADALQYGQYAHADEQEGMDTIVKGLTVAVANNFTNKSYLTGIGNLVEALEQPDRKMPQFFQRYAAAFVPNLAGQAVDVVDPNMREVRSITDALMSKVPGLSDNLPPQRNLLGEPITRTQALGADTIGSIANIIIPIAYREVSDSVIAKEMQDLKHGFAPPKTTAHGLDLTEFKNSQGQNAFDRWGELHGEVRVDGQTLKDTLRRTIKSNDYQRLSPVSTHDLDSPRITVLNRIVQDYRRAAYAKMLKEYPEVNTLERAFVRRRQQLSQGQDTRGFFAQD